MKDNDVVRHVVKVALLGCGSSSHERSEQSGSGDLVRACRTAELASSRLWKRAGRDAHARPGCRSEGAGA